MDRTRRRYLRIVGAGLLGGIAGCTGGDAPSTLTTGEGVGTTRTTSQATTGETTSTATPTEAATETESATPTAGETPTETATTTETPTETATATESATPTETETPTATATPTPPPEVRVEIANVGASAWEVVEDESGSVSSGGLNPTLTFEVGVRYAVTNGGWSAHPFALRASDGAPLVSQDATGRYEDDPTVDWRDDGDAFAFTVTDDLAADVDQYVCTIHAGMRGDVETR